MEIRFLLLATCLDLDRAADSLRLAYDRINTGRGDDARLEHR